MFTFILQESLWNMLSSFLKYPYKNITCKLDMLIRGDYIDTHAGVMLLEKTILLTALKDVNNHNGNLVLNNNCGKKKQAIGALNSFLPLWEKHRKRLRIVLTQWIKLLILFKYSEVLSASCLSDPWIISP